MPRDTRTLWRKLFICPLKPKGCQPVPRRDDNGFWDSCTLCDWHGPVSRFDGIAKISERARYVLPKAPSQWPTKFHFECAACEFNDEESRRLAGPLDFFCPLCKSDTGQANLLKRWPAETGVSRDDSRKAFEGSAIDAFLNARPLPPMSREELRGAWPLPVNQGGTHGPGDGPAAPADAEPMQGSSGLADPLHGGEPSG